MTILKRPIIWVPIIIFFSSTCFALPANSKAETRQFELGWKAYESSQYAKAFRIWHVLADRGHPLARINLGAMYDQGLGVKEDPTKAFELFHQAAVSGSAYAQHNLGNMYVQGRGIRPDHTLAKYWYLRAAEQDLAIAQFSLGLLLQASADQNGPMADEDRDAAAKWLYKSGLSYLNHDDIEGARLAHKALLDFEDGHPLEARLRSEIQHKQQKPHLTVSDPAFEGASFGTGWPISSGFVITNNHVVVDSDEILLLDSTGRQIKARAILSDELNDIAVLEVLDVNMLPPALPLATSDIYVGARVFTIGFPRIDVLGKTPKLTKGIISKLEGPDNDDANCQTTIPIQSGNSGGPLVNMRGEVVGVIRSMLALKNPTTGETNILENASCALKIEHIFDLFHILPQKNADIPTLPSQEGSLTTLARRVQDSVLIVVAR